MNLLHEGRRRLDRLAAGLLLLTVAFAAASAQDLAARATEYRVALANKILPYWYDTAVDWKGGGYQLADDAVKGRGTVEEKQIVTQARMVWGFSLAHRHGFSTPTRDYLRAAGHGVKFLRERMRDREHGGYVWSVAPDGAVRDGRKRIYGESFVIYALVEYYRASADRTALDEALQLYREIQRHAHDEKNGGWMEHFERDWTPLPKDDPGAIVELAGYKSANTHLHLMEALTELYAETRDPDVRRSLEESLRINQQYFYPLEPANSAFHKHPDWSPATGARSLGLSYGHNVEFAWLMVRAEQVLGRTPSWTHFRNHLAHTLRNGTDHERGGVYNRGFGDLPAIDTDKVWWVQSEMMAALTDGLLHEPGNASYARTLGRLIDFVNTSMADPRDGIWVDTVTADGRPKSGGKAHNWKANYHDVRAILKFVMAFETQAKK